MPKSNAPGKLQLKYNVRHNTKFLAYETWLASTAIDLADTKTLNDTQQAEKDVLLEELFIEWDQLDQLKMDEWRRQGSLQSGETEDRRYENKIFVPTGAYFTVLDVE